MINKLTMFYNRGRQAVITNELSKSLFWGTGNAHELTLNFFSSSSWHYYWCLCSLDGRLLG
jgi:hypothetical protein